jgi:hypothetical protein
MTMKQRRPNCKLVLQTRNIKLLSRNSNPSKTREKLRWRKDRGRKRSVPRFEEVAT